MNSVTNELIWVILIACTFNVLCGMALFIYLFSLQFKSDFVSYILDATESLDTEKQTDTKKRICLCAVLGG